MASTAAEAASTDPAETRVIHFAELMFLERWVLRRARRRPRLIGLSLVMPGYFAYLKWWRHEPISNLVIVVLAMMAVFGVWDDFENVGLRRLLLRFDLLPPDDADTLR